MDVETQTGSDVGRMIEHHTLPTSIYLTHFAPRRLLQAIIGQLNPLLWPMVARTQREHPVHYYFSLHVEES